MKFFRKNKSSVDIRSLVAPLGEPAIALVKTFARDMFSKMGSTPVVPEGFEWPEWNGSSLAFLMQLKFSEINGDGTLPYLPTSGLMYIFYDQEQSTWGFDPDDRGSWRILFYPETDQLKGKHYPKDMEVRYKEKMLVPENITTYPYYGDDRISALDFTDKQDDEYIEFKRSFFGDNPQHQLGGYPDPIQSAEMDRDCQLASNGLYIGDETGYKDPRARKLEKNRSEWTLLLQIDSDDDTEMMWGDCGMLYFWIRKDDLAALDFSNVWMILQCG